MRARCLQRRCAWLALAVAMTWGAEHAHAAPPGPGEPSTGEPVTEDNRKQADELFQEGRKLMREGRLDEACPILEKSQELDPAGGTLLNLSRCYEGLGRFASADALLARAWRLGRARGRADAVDFIDGERARIAGAVDRVVLILGELPPDAVLELDGKTVSERSPRVQLDIDPGEHRVWVRAPGYVDAETRFELRPKADLEGRSVEVLVPVLHPATKAKPTTPLVPSAPARKAAGPTPGRSDDVMAPAGTAALVGGGALLAAGLVFGVVAASTWSSVEERCPDTACNDADARDDGDTASAVASVSTGLVIAGLGLGGLGVALLVAAPATPDAPAERRAQLTLHEAF